MSAPLVSVSGVRGIVGESFTEELVRRWVGAFLQWCETATSRLGGANAGVRVVVARDTRPSGAWALDRAVEICTAAGVQPIVLGIVPTPTAQLAVTHHRAAGGLVITGSHNPGEWNALKFLGSDGVFLSAEAMRALERLAQRPEPAGSRSSPVSVEVAHDSAAITRHVESVLTTLPLDITQIRARKLRVVLDPVNGAGALAVPPLLERLGCTTVLLNGEPTGVFAHPPEPTPAHLTDLCARVKTERADLGLAVDPDADRLALVDETGTAVSEEYTVTLAAWSLLQQKTSETVVVNLSTTRMVDDVARRCGARVVRTPVGERHVVEGMRASGAAIGGEGNGGVMYRPCHEGRDSLVGTALLLDLLTRRNATLSALIRELPAHIMRKEKLPRTGSWDTGRVVEALRATFPDARLSTADGVRVDTADGWVHVRPSNTEPVIRLIAETNDEDTLERLSRLTRSLLDSTGKKP